MLFAMFLLLIGGAIINVAVAWTAAVRARTGYYLANTRAPMQRSASVVGEFAGRCGLVPDDAKRSFKGFVVRVVGRTMCEGSMLPVSGDETNRGVVFQVWEDGWPLNSMRACAVSGSDTKGVNGLHGIWCPPWVDENVFRRRGGYGFSCQPIWFGFILNSVLYAAAIVALFASTHVPGWLRRRSRINRNRCPACAYPIGTSSICTECGHPLKPASRA